MCPAAGANALGQNEAIVRFRRCAWHTLLRLYFWTGGFFALFLIQGTTGLGMLAKQYPNSAQSVTSAAFRSSLGCKPWIGTLTYTASFTV